MPSVIQRIQKVNNQQLSNKDKMPFSYKIERNDNHSVLTMTGRLVDKVEAIEVSVEIDEELEEGTNHFIINLSELDYMNSTGLNIIINLMNKARNEGGEAVVVGAQPRIKTLFVVTKLDTVFTMKDTLEEATTHLNAQL